MFRGFIKLILFIIGLAIIYGVFIALDMPIVGYLVIYLILVLMVPFVLHGSFRYRMSRTSYRGIRFGYRGRPVELFGLYLKGLLLTLITFGIYGAWFQMDLRRYIYKHIRYGDVSFSNDASGWDWFWINLKGLLLTPLTLGLYSFWWQNEVYAHYVNHLRAYRMDEEIHFKATTSGSGFLGLALVNLLILIFTLGLGFAWVEIRTMRYLFDKVLMKGTLELNTIYQTEEEYQNAFGDSASDFFEIDLA